MAETVRVLHVDDDAAFAELAATFLKRADERFEVETELSARAGLDRLGDEDFDCVVSDYDMSGRNGIEFLEAVREEHPNLPFILYTGKGSEEVASEAISAGATDYLQKESGSEQYELLANRIRNTVEQHRASRRAADLDRIRTLVNEVNQALVRAQSRSRAESRVCEIFSESEPYLFAWVGAPDDETNQIVPRTTAGADAGYFEEVTITADDSPTGQGPAGTALREGRVAVSQDVTADPEFEPWQDEALERGFRGAAAVPLTYGNTSYGVLVVYANRPHAFDENERELLGELGDDIAHAVHSFEVTQRLHEERDRRRALFENAPDPVIAGQIREDGTHRIIDANEAFREVFGCGDGTVVGQDIADTIIPEEGRARHERFREQAEAGTPVVAEVERITVEGPREFRLSIIPYGMDDASADGWYAWYTDLSERRP